MTKENEADLWPFMFLKNLQKGKQRRRSVPSFKLKVGGRSSANFITKTSFKKYLSETIFQGRHYIDILKQELSSTTAYEQTSEKEKSVINNHIFHNTTRFAVSVNEDQERLPTFYWLPKLHIRHDLLLILAHARLPNYQNY